MATVTGSQRLLTLSLNSITVGGGSVTSGTISNWNTAYSWGNHASAGYLTSVPNLDASKITTGTFSTARIPNLSASKITSGTFAAARIPDLSGTYAVTGHNHNGVYEPAFSKNNAFNKSFGTAAGTVAQGNDSRINNGQTAYGWGNHASAGYLTSLPSHNHDGRYYTESESDSRFVNVTGDTMTGTLTASGGINGLTLANGISGSNFNITGVNELQINDPGEGIRFGGGSSTVYLYAIDDSTDNNMNFGGANMLQVNGRRVFEANYHPNADKWTTARTHTVTLTGDVTGSASQTVDGTGNKTWTISTNVGDANTVDGYHATDLMSATSARQWSGLNASGAQAKRYTIMRLYICPAHWEDTLPNIKLFLHEETYESSYVEYHLWGDYNGGNQNTAVQLQVKDAGGYDNTRYKVVVGNPVDAGWDHSGQNVYYYDIYVDVAYYKQVRAYAYMRGHGYTTTTPTSNAGITLVYTSPSGSNISDFTDTKVSSYFKHHKIWNEANDGTGSGLDADLLDGQQGSHYLNYNNLTNKPTIPSVGNGTITINAGGSLTGGGNFTVNQSGNTTITLTGPTIPTSLPANGGNADTVDGVHAHGAVRNNQANKLVRTDGNGYIQAGWINTTSGATTNTLDRIYASNDGYIRYVTPATLGSQLSSHINYNNIQNKPTIPDTSNLVTTNTAQTISGAKTFSANVGVSGNVSANFYAFNGSYVNATTDVRAPIYYDRNNTSFYVHADGESVLGNVRANNFRLSTGDGKGIRFWNSDSYKIYMSSTGNSSWGGRAPYESTSDYNMYFRMKGGTNRGFVFRNDTTNVAGIDSSGNFNTSGIIKTGNGAASAPAYSFTADYDSGMFSIGSNAVGFATGGTQRFKINSNGLLLTGGSSLWVNGQQTITNTRDIANVVNYQNTDGHMQLHRTGAAPLIINRKGTTGSSGTSRGEIVNFKSASTKIGRIGYAQPYGGLLYFATGNTSGYGVGVYHFSTSSDLRPVTNTGANNDNAMDLGATSARYDDVYATNGTIQTSDRNEKQDIQELTDAETRAAVTCKGLMRRFRWVDSVTEKGDDARYHFGAIAQDVEAAFTAEGLDAGDYGLFIRSTWWEHGGFSYPSAEEAPEGAVEKTRLGIRYNQLFAFIIGAL